MKLAVLCLCILHLALVSAGFFARSDPQSDRSNGSLSRAQAPERAGDQECPECCLTSPNRCSEGSWKQGRQRTLFARRGQYERQRIHITKQKVVPVPPNAPPPPSKVAPEPAMLKCSQLAQSCLPQSGCCDPCVSCHCRFFNAICFCRRTHPQYEKQRTPTPQSERQK